MVRKGGFWLQKDEENEELTNLQMEDGYKHGPRTRDIVSSEERKIDVTTTMKSPGGTSEIV